jgi:hypothetical protein
MRTAPTITGICLLSCAALLGACGGSSTSTGTGSSGYSQAVKFSACMRSHGVPNFPDPSPSGGIQLTPAMGIKPFSPGFKTAQQACHRLLPGGLATGKASAQDKARLVALARCMRAHGLTTFPDPVSSAPSSPAGFSIIFGRPGAFIEIPSSINVQSPAFRQAAQACGFPLGPKR